MIAGMALLAGLAFLHANPEYVLRQYELFVETMQIARKPKQSLFCDIQGMFWAFGFRPPDLAMSLLRIVAAGITLGVAWLGVRRYDAFSKREEDEQGTYCIFTSAYRGSKNVNIAADPRAWMGRVSDEYDQGKLSGALS